MNLYFSCFWLKKQNKTKPKLLHYWNLQGAASEMAQQGKVLAARMETLEFDPWTHMVEEDSLLQVVLWLSNACCHCGMCALVHAGSCACRLWCMCAMVHVGSGAYVLWCIWGALVNGGSGACGLWCVCAMVHAVSGVCVLWCMQALVCVSSGACGLWCMWAMAWMHMHRNTFCLKSNSSTS